MDSQLHPPGAPPGLPAGAVSDVVEETVVVGGRPLRLLRPRDGDAVLDELLAEDDPDEDRLPFWTQLWPSGTALAQAIAARPLAGRRVLELGCGLGLVGVTAARGGCGCCPAWSARTVRSGWPTRAGRCCPGSWPAPRPPAGAASRSRPARTR